VNWNFFIFFLIFWWENCQISSWLTRTRTHEKDGAPYVDVAWRICFIHRQTCPCVQFLTRNLMYCFTSQNRLVKEVWYCLLCNQNLETVHHLFFFFFFFLFFFFFCVLLLLGLFSGVFIGLLTLMVLKIFLLEPRL